MAAIDADVGDALLAEAAIQLTGKQDIRELASPIAFKRRAHLLRTSRQPLQRTALEIQILRLHESGCIARQDHHTRLLPSRLQLRQQAHDKRKVPEVVRLEHELPAILAQRRARVHRDARVADEDVNVRTRERVRRGVRRCRSR